jgi:hypothetical protein
VLRFSLAFLERFLFFPRLLKQSNYWHRLLRRWRRACACQSLMLRSSGCCSPSARALLLIIGLKTKQQITLTYRSYVTSCPRCAHVSCVTRCGVADAEQTINHLLLTEEMGRHMDSRRAIYRFANGTFYFMSFHLSFCTEMMFGSCLLASLALRLNFSSAQARAQLSIITSNLIAVFNGR